MRNGLKVAVSFFLLAVSGVRGGDITTIPIPLSGNASLTHYDLPLGGYVASCGCDGNSSYYPTAALSQAAYGSSISSGPACGQCFNISLVSAYQATPPFVLDPLSQPWVVVKITDKCPALPLQSPKDSWCGATKTQVNKAGVYIHFDLSSPSPSIPLSFFPVPNNVTYGYSDFGAWLIHFDAVSCASWAGYNNDTASIVDPSLAFSGTGCCPSNPLINNMICPASSLKSRGAKTTGHVQINIILMVVVLSFLTIFCI